MTAATLAGAISQTRGRIGDPEPLARMGARIDATGQGTAPLKIHGGQKLTGIDYVMPVASAQVKSSLLLAGLYADGRTCVTEPAPTRDHTERMLRAFVWAGALGFVCILLFSLVGVHARLEGLAGGDNVPAALARSMGPAALFVMTIVMVAAAGSTLDSTFSSLARHVAQELPQLAGRPEPRRAIALGMGAMALFAIIGNLPMIAGTDILKATTISGTMVIGLAPIFLLAGFTQPDTRAAVWSFHLAFWTGLALGVLLANSGRSGAAPVAQEVAISRDGHEVHLAVVATPLVGEGGSEGQILVLDDVTPLIRAQKVAAWREVAGDAIEPDTVWSDSWTIVHFVIDNLVYHNFPYAFGMLFSLGLLAARDANPEGFIERFDALLADFDATLAKVWLVKPKRISIEDLVEDIPGQTKEAVSA